MAEVSEEATGKTDPRIKRTRNHVLQIAREMLERADEPLTFTAVAEEAFVARQTLYKHWGTIENLIADTIEVEPASSSTFEGLDREERARTFLTSVADQISGGTGAAVAAIYSAVRYSPESKAAVDKLDTTMYASFVETVGQIDRDGYTQIVAPVVYVALSGRTPSPRLINSLASRAAELIG
jgi:AcrR family transcriptional regulator